MTKSAPGSRLQPSPEDFARLEAWGLRDDPLRGLRRYRPWQAFARRFTPHWLGQQKNYRARRADWIGQADFEQYFQSADRTIDETGWRYLKERKAWYIAPWRWDEFAMPNTSAIIDVGCGDGDVTQRVVEHIAASWQRNGGEHPLHIVGVDIAPSRIANARRHTRSPHPLIQMEFCAVAPHDPLPFPDHCFDFAMANGVFEILNDRQAPDLARRIARITARGIYVEDLLDPFPGGFPRPDISPLFAGTGFHVDEERQVLTAPFTWLTDPDPLRLWPLSLVKLAWLTRAA